MVGRRQFNILSIFIAVIFSSLPVTQVMAKNVSQQLPHAIVEARKQMLGGKRLAAIKILKLAISENNDAKTSAQLESALTHLTQIFLTNEGQKKFELAESSRHSGGTGFLHLYQQALSLEPGNTKVMVGYVLGLLTNNDCTDALTVVSQIKAIDSNLTELSYLHFRAQLCADPTALTVTDDTALDNDKFLPLYRKIARAEEEFLRGDMKSALSFAHAAIKIDAKFPQGYYWEFKALSAKDGGINEGKRYIYLCRAINAETRRRYEYEPQLCIHTDSVASAIRIEEAQKHETN